jgi:hypothetical protein
MITSILRGAVLAAAAFMLVPAAHAEDAKAATPATAPAPAAQPMVVYDTALAPGWNNWSWAKTELSVELNGSARRPIKVEAGGWQALYLQHDPFNTAGWRKLSLLIQGSVPDREVRIFMLTEGKPTGEGKLVKISNTGWTKVEVPLATLGVEDRVVDGIWVQNASETELPKFYVTEIRLD